MMDWHFYFFIFHFMLILLAQTSISSSFNLRQTDSLGEIRIKIRTMC